MLFQSISRLKKINIRLSSNQSSVILKYLENNEIV